MERGLKWGRNMQMRKGRKRRFTKVSPENRKEKVLREETLEGK